MATVDIEPSSLALTPGKAEVFTLTVRNDGDEVEAYHLTAVDEAAKYVVIEPETLLVHPGDTATAAATITLEHTGRWAVGDLIVRFHIVPAVSPEDFLVVEAIATVESFSDVAALLSPTSLQGRRGDDAEISIANAGNVHAYADIAVSAGEVAVAIDQAHVAIPAGSTESVGLTVRANRLLWRGDPVPHPFHLSVTPEGGEPISVEGTFTQLPLLPGWGLKALIGVGAALAVLGLVWLGAAVWGSGGAPPATTAPATPSETPAPELVAVSLAAAGQAGEVQKAGDPAIAVLDVQVEDATPEALVAVDVEWPDNLALAEWTCEGWVDPENDRERSGQPRSGDECLIDPSGSGTEARLTFTTPPAGFSGAVTATAARLVAYEDGDVEAIESTTAPPQVAEELLIEAAPYPFWMEVEVAAPSASDDGTRRAVIWTHRTLGPEGTNERAQIAFQLLAPSFVEEPDLQAAQLPNGQQACDAGTEGDVCVLDFLVLADGFPQDLALWAVPVSLEISDDDPPAGLIAARGVSLTVGDDEVPDDQVGELVRSAEAPLLLSGGAFPVDVELDRDDADGAVVTATVELAHSPYPADAASPPGSSRMLGVTLSWPDALDLDDAPADCDTTGPQQLTCAIPGPEAGAGTDIELSFTLEDEVESVAVEAKGSMLTYAPDDAEVLGDELTAGTWPLRWIASDVDTLSLD